MQLDSRHVIQHVGVDSENEADREFWYWAERCYGDRVKRQGDWVKTLMISAHVVQDERESNRFRRHMGEELWQKAKLIVCDEFSFAYDDPDLMKNAQAGSFESIT